MLVKVPYLVHMDAIVDTTAQVVTRVEVHAETVFRNVDDHSFPIIEVESETPVSSTTANKAARIADRAEWPAWDHH